MFYRLLGMVVWKGVRFVVRRRLRKVPTSRWIGLAVSGATAVAERRRRTAGGPA